MTNKFSLRINVQKISLSLIEELWIMLPLTANHDCWILM